eukprot:195935-Rhodomonas_salina.4
MQIFSAVCTLLSCRRVSVSCHDPADASRGLQCARASADESNDQPFNLKRVVGPGTSSWTPKVTKDVLHLASSVNLSMLCR